MTDTGAESGANTATRRARIETDHGDRETAAMLARAVRPDNTAEMETRVEGSHVVTTIARETTGGLQSTADDYVVNLQVGAQVAIHEESTDESRSSGQDSNHNTDTHRDTNDSNTSDTDTTTHE